MRALSTIYRKDPSIRVHCKTIVEDRKKYVDRLEKMYEYKASFLEKFDQAKEKEQEGSVTV